MGGGRIPLPVPPWELLKGAQKEHDSLLWYCDSEMDYTHSAVGRQTGHLSGSSWVIQLVLKPTPSLHLDDLRRPIQK